MPDITVNLIVPGLLNTFQKEEITPQNTALPGQLPGILARSDLVNLNESEIKLDYQNRLPISFYEYFDEYFQPQVQARVLYANPVFLQIQTDHLLSKKPEILLKTRIISEFVNALDEYFKEDGLSFLQSDNGKIYCLSTEYLDVNMIAFSETLGRNINHFLPTGKDATFWKRIFNEVQMFIHQYCSSSDLSLEFNALWFWGGDMFFEKNKVPNVIGNAKWIKGYNRYYKMSQLTIDDLGDVSEPVIYFFDERFIESSSTGDFTNWKRQLDGFYTETLSPVMKLLYSGKIKQVLIHKTVEHGYRVSRLQGFRFFRKKLTVHQICGQE